MLIFTSDYITILQSFSYKIRYFYYNCIGNLMYKNPLAELIWFENYV